MSAFSAIYVCWMVDGICVRWPVIAIVYRNERKLDENTLHMTQSPHGISMELSDVSQYNPIGTSLYVYLTDMCVSVGSKST